MPLLSNYRRRVEKKDKASLEVKLRIGKTFREDRCSTGKSKRLAHKFVFAYIGKFGKQFMEELSLLAEDKDR